jgi:hypothetical protein
MKLNIVDAAAVLFLAALLPLAYGSYLLFKPARPRIDSVSLSEISREERRIGNGSLLTAKLKVLGTGFNPMMRATIDMTPSLGFVFENPNSADVLLGPTPPGPHDLVLYDGAQEVARAVGAVVIQETVKTWIRASGWLTDLDPALMPSLVPGYRDPGPDQNFTLVAIGPTTKSRSRASIGASVADLPTSGGGLEREAVIDLRCDPAWDYANACNLAGRPLTGASPITVFLTGPLKFEIFEVFPISPPRRARIEVELANPPDVPKPGDRDHFLDARAAVVIAASRHAVGTTVTLELGVDDSREGWRYRSGLIRPGAPFTLATDRYVVSGVVRNLQLLDQTKAQP